MANKTPLAISVIIALWIAVLGLCCVVIGLSGALSKDEMETWLRGLMWVLAVSGGFMMYGGFNMIVASKKKSDDIDKDEKELEQAVKQPVNMEEAVKSVHEQAAKLFPDKNTLLAHWTYNAEEWNIYTKKEFKFRIRQALILCLLIVGLGTWLMAGYRDMGHLSAFITSFSVGGLITLIRVIIANNERKANSSKPGDVIISAKSILINGKYHTLNDENITLTKLELLTDEQPPILEFSISWNTRKGPTNDEIRVPVPSEKKEDALKLVSLFNDEVIGKY